MRALSDALAGVVACYPRVGEPAVSVRSVGLRAPRPRARSAQRRRRAVARACRALEPSSVSWRGACASSSSITACARPIRTRKRAAMLAEALMAMRVLAGLGVLATLANMAPGGSGGGGGRPPVPPGGASHGWRFTVAGWVHDPTAPPPPGTGTLAPPAGSSGSGRWSGEGSCAVWHDVDGRKLIDGRWFEPQSTGDNIIYRTMGRVLIEPTRASFRNALLSSQRLRVAPTSSHYL